jgi:hypothetical protein
MELDAQLRDNDKCIVRMYVMYKYEHKYIFVSEYVYM